MATIAASALCEKMAGRVAREDWSVFGFETAPDNTSAASGGAIWETNGTNVIGGGSLGNSGPAGTPSPAATSTMMVTPKSCGRTITALP
jgi:hypothetical protein